MWLGLGITGRLASAKRRFKAAGAVRSVDYNLIKTRRNDYEFD
jgi:hypothetical protein